MNLNRTALSGVLTMLLAIGSAETRPASAIPTSSPHLAQAAPNVVTGRLDGNSRVHWDGSYYNVHPFEGIAGQTFVFDFISSDFDAYLILIGPDGRRVTQDDDSGDGTNAHLVLTLPATGTYEIWANAYWPGTAGSYRLSWGLANADAVAAAEPPPPPVSSMWGLLWDAIDGEVGLPPSGEQEADRDQAARPNPAPHSTNQSAAVQRASALNQQSIELYRAGRYPEAESRLQEALAIWRTELGDRHPTVSNGLSGLALLYRVQGRHDEAEPLYQEVLAIDRENLGETHPDVAQNLRNLADLYYFQGRYGEAEPLYEEALSIRRRLNGDRHPDVAISLHDLARVSRVLGRYDEAERLMQEALSIYREQFDRLHPNIANGLNDLASVYVDQGRYHEAESLLQQSLALKREALGNRHLSVSNGANNLAVLYGHRGRYDEAKQLYEEALSIRREQLGDRHQAVAQSLNNLASILHAQGRYGESISRAQEGLDIRRERLGNRSPVVAQSLVNLSKSYLAQDTTAPAITTLREGLEIEEWNLDLNLATLTEAQRQAYAVTLADTTHRAISLHLQAAPTSADAAHLALTTLLRRKGRILEAGTQSLNRLRQNLTPEDQATLDRLTQTQQQLATFIFNPADAMSPDQYRARLTELETIVNQLESTLTRRSAAFRATATPVDVAAVQAQIPHDGVLMEYVRYRPFDASDARNPWGANRYATYLLFPDGRLEAVDLGDAAAIDASVQSFIRLLQDRRTNFQSQDTNVGIWIASDQVETVTQDIRSLLLDPIAEYVGDRQHLLISPDSQLNRLPFEALQTDDGRYLVEQYQISYLNSGRDLLKFEVTEPSPAPAVVLANPDYETAPVADARDGARPRSTELSQMRFGALPGTAREAEALRQLLPNATILVEQQATEQALKQVDAPRILHIATHGFFLEDQAIARPNRDLGVSLADASGIPALPPVDLTVENPLLRSGLALAGFNPRRSGGEDGVFTALEATNLNLYGTQLVVLSACDTGLGDIANGEGVYGLRRAFDIAGAETQLMSLWRVSDEVTQTLMTRYYENLTSGLGRSKALREVQLAMIRESNEYSHPYYWASFILAGDWRPLDF